MLSSIRINLTKFLIDLNEKLIFEKRLQKYYKNNFNTDINLIIDVGSNKGQTIDFFLQINPQCIIYGFEPNVSLYQKLTKKYKYNSNIKIFNLGISEISGKKLFFENIFDYTSSFEELNHDSKYLKRKANILGVSSQELIKTSYQVDTTTLSDFINNYIQQPIDILKIDTEGHEFSCLKGLFKTTLNKPIKYIQLENHNDDMYANKISFSKIKDLLEGHGFYQDKTVRHGFGDLDEIIFKSTV